MQTTQLFGYQLVNEKMTVVVDHLDKHLHKNKNLILIATPNPEQIVLASANSVFGQNLQHFDWLLPDGQWLVWASRLLAVFDKAQPLKNRLTGIDLVPVLLELAWRHKQRVLLIGGRDYLVGLHQIRGHKFDLIKVEPVSWQTKPATQSDLNHKLYWWSDVGESPTSDQSLTQLQAVLSQTQPQIVLVALGAPYQEQLLMTHRQLLASNQVQLAMVVGGSFDVLLGQLKRAPQWMQDLGLEWLYRLIQQPWRWRRQLRLIEFVWLVIRQVFAKN